jgi:hypothetical protein
MTNNNTVSKKDLIADLRRVRSSIKGASLTRRTYRSLGAHASSTVEEKFYGWTKAKRAAGIR